MIDYTSIENYLYAEISSFDGSHNMAWSILLHHIPIVSSKKNLPIKFS